MLGRKPGGKRILGVTMIFLTLGVVASFSGCIVGPPTELYYDDGTAENFGANAFGMWDAVEFTPPPDWQSWAVVEARVYVDVAGPGSFKLHVMSDLETDIITPVDVSPTTTGWVSIDLKTYGITVSGDFYIAIEYPPDQGFSDVMLGLDRSDPDLRSYVRTEYWTLMDRYDFMIRATVAQSLFDPARV